MDEYESLSHSKWECKYHVVFIPKCRRKTLYGELRPHLGDVFRKLALQKESRVEEGHLMLDHVHMMISIPPKYAVSQVVGFIKGKSAIYLARVYGEKKRNFVGQHFWARGYFVSTVGRDEAVIREYIKRQEQEDNRLEQMKALSKAIRRNFGRDVAIQRCQIHKARNIQERLPKSLHASVRRVLRQAWELDDADKAEKLLRNLARRLERDWAGVAGSILEGIDEILTVTRLR